MKDKKTIQGIIQFTSKGSAFLINPETDIFVYKSNTYKALHGDKVEIELIPGKRSGEVEGRVIKIIERARTQFVGILEVSKTYGFVLPDSKRMFKDIFIPKSDLKGYKHGEKVLCEITKWMSKAKNPNGRIVKSLGFPGENDAEIHSILYEYGLDVEFPQEVENESEDINFEISEEEISKRKDYRNITTLTIDPETAKDFDDALSVQRLDNGNIEVGIHIADVSHYVKPGSELDKEAYKRGTSVYLVDRVVPMLPERLSNGVCSLRPNEDKLAFSAILELDNDGIVQKEWFGKTVIHSDRRFTYEEAQDIIEGSSGDFEDEVRLLDKLAKKIRKRRLKNGISFDKTEVKFKLDEEGKPLGIIVKTNKDSNKLIEEFMLLANKRAATLFDKIKKPFVYRTHQDPDEEQLMELSVIASEFKHSLDLKGDIKKQLNELLKAVKDKPEQNLIEQLMIKSMSKAKYESLNIGHYGLGFENYTHFTSPIRRYPDVMVHRLLHYHSQNNGEKIKELEEKCKWCSFKELKAQRAERDSIKFKQAEYLLDNVGKEYEAVITGIKKWGVYAEIKENKCEGMIPIEQFKDLGFGVDLDNHSLYSDDKEYRLGDDITIKIKSVSLAKKEIDFGIPS